MTPAPLPRPQGGVRCSFGTSKGRGCFHALGARPAWPRCKNWSRGRFLAFSALGFSLPELTITGEAGPRAAWGGPLDVSALYQNIGTSTMTEPLSQAPATQPPTPGSPYGNVSTADAPDTMVTVFATRTPKTLTGAIDLGEIEAPPLSQNSVEQLTAEMTLPARPAGFPGPGGTIYLWFEANSSNSSLETTHKYNLSKPVAVKLTRGPLPELRAISLGVPSTLSPGDTITPQIQIENFGTADPDLQGPVTVDLVASVTKSFTLGSSIVASYTIDSIPAVSQTPTSGNYLTFAQQIVNQPNNVVTIIGSPVTLPTSPAKYYLGVVVGSDRSHRSAQRAQEQLRADQGRRPQDQVSASGRRGEQREHVSVPDFAERPVYRRPVMTVT